MRSSLRLARPKLLGQTVVTIYAFRYSSSETVCSNHSPAPEGALSKPRCRTTDWQRSVDDEFGKLQDIRRGFVGRTGGCQLGDSVDHRPGKKSKLTHVYRGNRFSCPEVFMVEEMIPTLLRVLCTKRSDSSSPQSGSAPKGLHSRKVAAGHRARPESPRGQTCKAPGRAQAPSGSATRLPGADRGAPAPAS